MNATTATSALVGRSKFPFTATQYQELEHQAMIYKYLSAGIPIPPDLLFSIKTSLHSSLSSNLLFPYQSSPLGWNPYEMGCGKKIDPEPGRCRRTDGKKWRCSKEAYLDSKYCERHMHRGKNRSRKHVESPLINTNTISSTNHSLTSATTSLNASLSSPYLTNQSLFTNKNPSNSSLYTLPCSDSTYNLDKAHLLYPQSASYSHDYREKNYLGLKDKSSESSMRGFFGSSIDESSQLREKQNGVFPNYLQSLQITANNNNNNNHYNDSSARQQQEKQCYIWGRDFNCDLSMKIEEEKSIFSEKTIHHFFDELPIESGGGRGGFGDDSSSTTQLSISIPSSTSHHHDFFRNP